MKRNLLSATTCNYLFKWKLLWLDTRVPVGVGTTRQGKLLRHAPLSGKQKKAMYLFQNLEGKTKARKREARNARQLVRITSDQTLFQTHIQNENNHTHKKEKNRCPSGSTKGGSYANRMVITRGILPRFHKSFPTVCKRALLLTWPEQDGPFYWARLQCLLF